MLIDTHCHLSVNDYSDLDEKIKNFNGIMITSGCNDSTNIEVLELVSKYPNVYGTLGIHPEEIDNITSESFTIIENNINNPKIVAIGEIGLDYYWVKNNKEKQKELLIKQLDIAKKYNKPIVIHSRESIGDIYEILKQYNLKGTIHSFSSSIEMAHKFIKLGYKIGVGGVVTFKNGKKLQEVVKNIDIKDLVIETDSPYLSPEPFRGKKNYPDNTYYVALKIAELKGMDVKDVINITERTAVYLFDLKK